MGKSNQTEERQSQTFMEDERLPLWGWMWNPQLHFWGADCSHFKQPLFFFIAVKMVIFSSFLSAIGWIFILFHGTTFERYERKKRGSTSKIFLFAAFWIPRLADGNR